MQAAGKSAVSVQCLKQLLQGLCCGCRGPEAGAAGGDALTSPPKSDSIGSGVTEEGEIAAVLSRMLDQAGRVDAQAVGQVRPAGVIQSCLLPWPLPVCLSASPLHACTARLPKQPCQHAFSDDDDDNCLQGNRFMEVGGVPVVQLVRFLRARLSLALNLLRPARRDIRAILAADPNSPQV